MTDLPADELGALLDRLYREAAEWYAAYCAPPADLPQPDVVVEGRP